jgi:hypothetical protein
MSKEHRGGGATHPRTRAEDAGPLGDQRGRPEPAAGTPSPTGQPRLDSPEWATTRSGPTPAGSAHPDDDRSRNPRVDPLDRALLQPAALTLR